jgi:putative serine protease PepD
MSDDAPVPVLPDPAPQIPAPPDAAMTVQAQEPPLQPAAPEPVPAWAPPPAPARYEPAQRVPGVGRVAGIAALIALVGVLLSVLAGGSAGFIVAQLETPAAGPSVSVSAPVSLNGSEEPVAAAAAIALPSVVNIDVTGTDTATGLPGGHPVVPSEGTGSGVAYKATPDGSGTYIITNDHVVTGAARIVVTPASGEQITASLVGTDPETDIAVVEVPIRLPLLKIGDSETLAPGQTVVAIGSPFGLQHSVSSGVVSAIHRSLPSGTADSSGSTYPLVDVIQTDAAINPGNSGGALVDRQGRLVGINSAIYTDSGNSAGVGFAIPSKTATRIADELIAGGRVTHPFLGIEGSTVSSEEASAAGLAKAEGAIVSSAIPNTGAARAGLKKGDIVTAVNGTVVRTMDDLLLAVRRLQVGDKATLSVWRNRATISIVVTVGDKPASLG